MAAAEVWRAVSASLREARGVRVVLRRPPEAVIRACVME